jgi:hypothetical protein
MHGKQNIKKIRDICLPGMLNSANWQLITHASRKHIGPIIKGQTIEEVCLTLNLEPTGCPETSATTKLLCVTPKKNKYLMNTAAEAEKIINNVRLKSRNKIPSKSIL